MLTIVHRIIDSIFPPRDTERLIRSTTDVSIGTHYHPLQYQSVTHLTTYETPLIQALIKENKYYENNHATTLLATLLATWKRTRTEHLIFIPIPLSPDREKDRGYNQVTRILKYCEGLQYNDKILEKVTETVSQTSLKKVERIKNVRHVFRCNGQLLEQYSDTTVVLLDDVVTTGATLQAAEAAVRPYLPTSCKLICLAIAH